jgi:hypothetical protein
LKPFFHRYVLFAVFSAVGTGAGVASPWASRIVGGLAVSQKLTLFTTPVIYLYIDELRKRFSVRRSSHRFGLFIPGGAAQHAD